MRNRTQKQRLIWLLFLSMAIGVILIILFFGTKLTFIIDSLVPLPKEFSIDEPKQLDAQQEEAMISGLLRCSDSTPLNKLDVKVYVQYDSQNRWQLSDINAQCHAQIWHGGWSIEERCVNFDKNYTSFTLVAVLVETSESAFLPPSIDAPDTTVLKEKIQSYVYEKDPICISPPKTVKRAGEAVVRPPTSPADTPTPTHIPTPTDTPSPTDTPEPTLTATPTPPDAVVNIEALNLRSGPGVVYDILGVLKQGDPLGVTGKCPAGDWLKVICPDEKEGWVAVSCLEINKALTAVPIAQVPPTPTPMYTLTPTVTPTPDLFPPPTLLEPENGASFAGWHTFKWQLAVEHSLQANEYFSFRVYEKGEGELCHREEVEELCHHIPLRALEYTGGLSYCPSGDLCWGVTLVRKLCEVCPEEQMWQILSQPSEDRLIHYQTVDDTEPPEPWPKQPPKEQPPKEPPK